MFFFDILFYNPSCFEEVKKPVPIKPRRSIRRLPDRSPGEGA